MVTKFAATHGVDSAAKDLVTNFMATPRAQTQLAAANGRPRRTSRRRSSRRHGAGAVQHRVEGRRADAEHPPDGLGLVGPRPGVGPLDEGQRRRWRPRSPSRERRAASPPRSASSVDRISGRPSGRPLSFPSRILVSATTAPTPAVPSAPFKPGRISRAVASLLGPPGTRDQDHPALGHERARDLGRIRAREHGITGSRCRFSSRRPWRSTPSI